MDKLTWIQQVKHLNMKYMENVITLQEYKKEVQAIVDEVPEELTERDEAVRRSLFLFRCIKKDYHNEH